MANVMGYATNGVSFGLRHTVTAADQSAAAITFEFEGVDYQLCPSIMLLASNGAVLALTGAVITFPAVGQVRIANGGGVSLTAGQIVCIQVARDRQE